MPDPKSQVDMFEDDRLDAVLGNMLLVEDKEEAPEKDSSKEQKVEE